MDFYIEICIYSSAVNINKEKLIEYFYITFCKNPQLHNILSHFRIDIYLSN